MENPQLIFEQVDKRFGKENILNKLSFSIGGGEVVLLLGANGSGKSTTLRLAAGLTRPQRGKVIIAPQIITSRPGLVSYSGHNPLLYLNLTIRENFSLQAELNSSKDDIDQLIASLDLTSQQDKRVSELSKGQQARASLGRALLGFPKILVLDEPTASLDERSAQMILSLLQKRCTEGGASSITLIATHDLNRFEPLVTRALLLYGGSISDDSRSGSIAGTIDRYRQHLS